MTTADKPAARDGMDYRCTPLHEPQQSSDTKSAAAWHPGDGPVEPVDIYAIRARADAATLGPWSARSTGRAGGDHWYICDEGEAIAHVSASDGENGEQRQPDAEFIAHAREDIPALLAALAAEKARADQAELRVAAVLRNAAVVAYKGPEDTDTAMLRTAARNLDQGFALGGGNLTRTVVNVLRAVAAILDDANAAPTTEQ